MGIPPVRLLDKVRKTSPACQQYSEGDSKSCKIVRNFQACGQEQYKKPEFDVHLVWGEHDTFIPLEQGRELKGLLAADSFTVIKNAAHIVHEDAPEAIVGALLRNL